VSKAWASASGARPRKGGGLCSRGQQEVRHRLGLLQPAAVEHVSPSERDHAAQAGEALEFERPERQPRDRLDQRCFLFGGQQIGRVAQAVRPARRRAPEQGQLRAHGG
jgi:hypothetical protein